MPEAPIRTVDDPVDDLTPSARAAVDTVNRLTYTVDETLAILGIGRNAFYDNLINTGRLRTVQVGRRRLVPRVAIDDFLAGAA